MSISTIIEIFGEYHYEFYLDSENPEFYHAIIISKLHDRTIRSLNIGGIRNVPVGHFDVSENGSNFIVLKLQPEIGPKYYSYNLAVVDGRIRAHEQFARSAYPNKTFARLSKIGHFREVEYLTCKPSGSQLTRNDVTETVWKSLKTPAYNDINVVRTAVFKNLDNTHGTFVVSLLLKTKHGEIYSKIGIVDKHGILRWVCEGNPWVAKYSNEQECGVNESSLDHFHVEYHEKTRCITVFQDGNEKVNLKFDEFYSTMTLQNTTEEEPTQPPAESEGHPTITDKQQFEIKLKSTGVTLDDMLSTRHTELIEEISQLQKKIEDHQKLLKSMKTELQDIQVLQQSLQQTRQLNQS